MPAGNVVSDLLVLRYNSFSAVRLSKARRQRCQATAEQRQEGHSGQSVKVPRFQAGQTAMAQVQSTGDGRQVSSRHIATVANASNLVKAVRTWGVRSQMLIAVCDWARCG